MKRNNFISISITCIFLLFIFWYSSCNFHIISKSFTDFLESRITIRKMNEDISSKFKSDDLFHKDDFINLNGIYIRYSGRRYYNGVVLMKNGMLTAESSAITKPEEKTASLVKFKDFVEERGGHYIWAQFPHKFDYEMDLLPDGMERNTIKDLENLLDDFQEAGIDVIDTLPVIVGDEEALNKYYYRTDIHWKPTGAFRAFQMIMEKIQALYSDEYFPPEIMDIENWTVHEIQDQFLGTWGKRVGQYFIGLDPLEYITPNFETDVSLSVPNKKRFSKGDYSKAFLQAKYMEPGGDKLHTVHYDIYRRRISHYADF